MSNPRLNIKGFSGKESQEFQKHLKAVKFCLENELSFPKETSDFFRGKVDSCDLEDYKPEYILNYIENGVEVYIRPIEKDDNCIRIRVADIPKEVDELIISISY